MLQYNRLPVLQNAAKSLPTLLTTITIVAVALLAFARERSINSTGALQNRVQRPNIVIILADDLGWNDVGYHGSKISTPNIDQLAREGIELDRFYVTPVCSPTRAGLMTGRYPIRFGMSHWPVAPYDTGKYDAIPLEEELLPEMLARAGYTRRGMFGKWHLGHISRDHLPLERGFTHFYGHYNGYIDYFTHQREGELDWHRQWETSYDEGYSTDLIAKEAARFIRESASDVPFFAYVAFNAPHPPLQVPPSYLQRYKKLRGERRNFAGMVESMDEGIGRILQALGETGQEDRTLVLFLSDNGGNPGHGGSNKPLRGGKGSVFEGGIRVPAVIRWPNRLPGGEKVQDPMAYIDILPTIKRIVGDNVHAGQPLDGVDMFDVLTGEQSASPEHELLFHVGCSPNEKMALRTDRWKLIYKGPSLLSDSLGRGDDLFLFRIEKDPFEKENLVAQHPDLVQTMLAKLQEFRSLQPSDLTCHTGGQKNEPESWKAPAEWEISE
jgi:arylsulfatase B